ncbi:sulfotransferase family 2 domain-containing protein [Lentisphaera profundi]|uniref:Sulfotransferase family 2 domain-containing protein n=1 Tax=Lentisphaera profundi TaxID=1658616 RepID=A0ABY7VY72_9BACT|nr:sulfotransferase family 2 domain-containing protein [Lentisphaera profundi]WDE99120.1 sulfotransferase family 2 domain-containing protein [Lentisphaera profundi]
MICHELKCVFVHIPKVAGTSIEKAFLQHLKILREDGAQLLIQKNADPLKGPPHLQHMTAEEYLKYGYLTQEQFDSYFKFTFVRDPYERIVSEYRYRRFYNEYDFKSYLTKNFPGPMDDDYVNYLDYYRHIMPQSDFIYNEKGELLVDFIGRFENIEDDFKKICEHLQVKLELPKSNKSKNKKSLFLRLKKIFNKNLMYSYSHDQYYCDDTLSFMKDYYKKDFEMLNYHFRQT